MKVKRLFEGKWDTPLIGKPHDLHVRTAKGGKFLLTGSIADTSDSKKLFAIVLKTYDSVEDLLSILTSAGIKVNPFWDKSKIISEALCEGKEERYGVKTITDDGAKISYFSSPKEREEYVLKLKSKLGSKLKDYKLFDKFTTNSVLKK